MSFSRIYWSVILFKLFVFSRQPSINRSESMDAGILARMKKSVSKCQNWLKRFNVKWILNFLQNRNIAIFYGSQTGTAEEFAGRLAKDAQRYGMKALVLDPEGRTLTR